MRTVPVRPTSLHSLREQILFRADDDPVMGHVEGRHIIRTAGTAEVQPPPLTDGIGGNALVAADDAAALVDEVAGLEDALAFVLQEALIVVVRDEADILAFRLVEDRQAPFFSQFPRMDLFQAGHGE